MVLGQDSSTRTTGHVLVLDNERVLEGDITREGEVYVIRRSVGEMKIPASKALVVCGSLDDVFGLHTASVVAR